jgi:3-methyl-2-oxobutanoate hydroxymethyltransferase
MKITKRDLGNYKLSSRKITMVTSYDFPCASIADECGIDVVLVGDSVGTNVLGYTEASQVTMEDMLHHVRAVARGVMRAFILADLPAEAIASPDEALHNAQRLLENGADGVKIEGGVEVADRISRMAQQGVAVCAHIGYTPQKMGRKAIVQGKDLKQAQELIGSALALEKAGAFMIVLELITEELSGEISRLLKIPTIGIGAGPLCDGQVQVIHDISGLSPRVFKHAKAYGNVRQEFARAISHYAQEVREGVFPTDKNAFSLGPEVLKEIKDWIEKNPKKSKPSLL